MLQFLATVLIAATSLAPTVTAEQFRAITLKDRVITIVDVRGADAYGDSHIPGAINVPTSALRSAKQAPKAFRKDREAYFYCTCPEDGASQAAAQLLRDRFGFTKVYVLTGGMYDWEDAGYPMTKGRTGTTR